MYRPFTEEDALARLEAQEQKDEEDEEDLLAELNQEVQKQKDEEDEEDEEDLLAELNQEVQDSELCMGWNTDMRTSAFSVIASAPQQSPEVYSPQPPAPSEIRQCPVAVQYGNQMLRTTGARTPAPSTKHRVAQASPEQASSSPPPYEPRFIKFNNMTEEIYDELEDDNKIDFIKVFVQDGKA
jgi:hypothetical protein